MPPTDDFKSACKEIDELNEEYYPKGHFFDRTGKKIGFEEWANLFEIRKYRVVRQDYFNEYMISTVWLGINESFSPSESPLLFETMIFNEVHSTRLGYVHRWKEDEQYRYYTEQQALRGHAIILKALLKRQTVIRRTRPWKKSNLRKKH